MRLSRLRRTPPTHAPPTHAFCEPVTATPTSYWHIRDVGEEGLKLGGGVPVAPLCGRDLRHGWDLKSEVTPEAVTTGAQPRPGDGRVFVCPTCAAVYLAEQPHPPAQNT